MLLNDIVWISLIILYVCEVRRVQVSGEVVA